MKRIVLFIILIGMSLVYGCSNDRFTSINHHQSFVASMNILEPSLTFYGESGDKLANWEFEKNYRGALYIPNDRVLLYGHQLTDADLYELSSGKHLRTIDTGLGTTNAYYDLEHEKIFMTNSETNTVTSFNHQVEKMGECYLGDYPLSMDSHDGLLYVINYKDTKLSIVDIETMLLQEEWEIEKSSTGIIVIPEKNEAWIGGHGEGSKLNRTVDIYDIETGKKTKQIPVSMMPVDFARNEQNIYIINHGANELYVTNVDGEALWHKEVAANPFAVEWFGDNIVVAGFDDHHIYFLEDQEIIKTIETGNGPFQLFVREVK